MRTGMGGYIDMHQHIAYGIDDGARTMDEAIKMIYAAYKDGVRMIFATPHVSPGEKPFPIGEYSRQLGQLNAYIDQHSLDLQILPGAEILYTEATLRLLKEGNIPSLGSGAFVLVEFLPDIAYDAMFDALRQLANASYTTVVAHIERYDCLVKTPHRVRELKDTLPLRMQVNCSTILRPSGFRTRRFLKQVLGEQLLDYLATDAHGVDFRPTCMRACEQALSSIYSAAYVEGLLGRHQEELIG